MCIKQILDAISIFFKKIRGSKSRIIFWVACHLRGYCPTLSERKNNEIEKLADKLKGPSDKETLVNILEWQDRNIVFWNERHPMSTIFGPIIIVTLITALFSTLFIVMANIQLLPFFTNIFVSIWLKIFLSSAVTALVIMAWIIRSNRKIPLKEGLWNAFIPSISLPMLLEPKRRIGVCRDYAKLTACLLSNTNPNAEIYFVHSTGHVATGIRVEKEVYVLDQHLPVLTIAKWDKREHSNKTSHKLEDNRLESVPTGSLLSKTNPTKLDEEELAEKMSKLLNILTERDDAEVSTLILRKSTKGAILYAMNDELVNYSLARALKNKISNELIELDQITKLEIEKENDDLIFKIHFRKQVQN